MKTEEELQAHHLYKFLCRNCLLDKFLNNTLNSDTSSRIKAAREFINKKITFIEFLKICKDIDLAFTWSETPEGHDFWSTLNSGQKREFFTVFDDYNRMIVE